MDDLLRGTYTTVDAGGSRGGQSCATRTRVVYGACSLWRLQVPPELGRRVRDPAGHS